MIIKEKLIEVPKGIRFLSDWEDFRLSNFPLKGILNKQIPGCGFTEYCINGPENIILCSPRKMLLENKHGQHEDDVYLVVNDMDKDVGVDKDLSKVDKYPRSSYNNFMETLSSSVDPSTRKKDIYNRLHREIREYMMTRDYDRKPYKILVTYDSYRIVQDILIDLGRFSEFYTIIDEFQSILHDARFKSATEIEFLEYLKRSHSALYVSATPMMDEYLDMLSEFDGLHYFELDWGTLDQSRVIRPALKVLSMKSVGTKLPEIIQSYLDGNFEKAVRIVDDQPVEIISREAVFYVNSVNHIISIIKKTGITPEQTNILCSKTDENLKRIQKKLGKKWTIGKVPKKTEPNKMFTFCTRTVYLGADFYSKCARSFIFSDSNIDSLAVDISEDLPQILGRQRWEDNPWKNSATLYYRTTCDYRKVDMSEFTKLMDDKKKKSESLLRGFNDIKHSEDRQSIGERYQFIATAKNYKDDYVAVNVHSGSSLVPVINNLVIVNELRAFRIQQLDYKDRFTVFSTIHNKLDTNLAINQEVADFFNKYDTLGMYYDKAKLLCNYPMSDEAYNLVLLQIPEEDNIRSHFTALGRDRIKALGYNATRIRKELGINIFNCSNLSSSILSLFCVGDRVSASSVKDKLKMVYNSESYNKTPKSSDLSLYFQIREVLVPECVGSKKRVRGIEILDVKPEYAEEYEKEQKRVESLKINNNYDSF